MCEKPTKTTHKDYIRMHKPLYLTFWHKQILLSDILTSLIAQERITPFYSCPLELQFSFKKKKKKIDIMVYGFRSMDNDSSLCQRGR